MGRAAVRGLGEGGSEQRTAVAQSGRLVRGKGRLEPSSKRLTFQQLVDPGETALEQGSTWGVRREHGLDGCQDVSSR